jgi:hypothetical protein
MCILQCIVIQTAPSGDTDTALSIRPSGIRPASMSKLFPPFQDNVMRISSGEEMSLKMTVLPCVEISGFFCPLPQHHTPEERKPRLDRCANVKPRTYSIFSNLL